MENEKRLADFENEYYAEINSYEVTDKDLVSVKINPKVLAYEVYLRKAFGDSFASAEAEDDYNVDAGRKVEKLSKDKLDNSELVNIMNDITTSEFDDNVDAIIHAKR